MFDTLKTIWGGGRVEINLIAPIGVSFYTFQAVGYLFDVYYKRISSEKNLLDYMLFVCFFPQILSGPISKAKDLLPQIKSIRPFRYNAAVQGLRFLLWGFFLKVVMADRLALYVDTVLDNYQYNSGVSCFVASLCYTFQIYGDFAGYSLMAIGTGRLMGFELINNFNKPYLSVSITEFWRRWHISLSRWLKDYVYIPLGGSRCSKKRNYGNIFITFLVSGIWHGANWTFIVWGCLHGLFQILEKALGCQKYQGNSTLIKCMRILVTFMVVNFAWLVFRMPTIEDAWNCFIRMFTCGGGLLITERTTILLMGLSVLITVVKDIIEELYPKNNLCFNSNNIFYRWSSYCLLLLYILLFGVFDSSQFIYVSF